MLIAKLAFKNIYGAGLRTWLNVIALSFGFVAIIFIQGLINGMTRQMETSNINAYYGGGQYWQKQYDPYDPLTIDDAHEKIPFGLQKLVNENNAVAILVRQATIYPKGRMQTALLKGIPDDQNLLSIPTTSLQDTNGYVPGLIGARMAKNTGLAKDDYVMVRWRDVKGTYDAIEIKIAEVMNTNVMDIDNGQIWIPLEKMREMTGMPNQATMVVLQKNSQFNSSINNWEFKDLNFLLKDTRAAMEIEQAGDSLFYIVLLLLAMLSIFDTQILSIYRRRKEMGTLMALGMTRKDLIQLFTIEGAMHAVLAAILATIYGAPLLFWLDKVGLSMPGGTADSFGLALGDAIYPIFSAGLIVGTILIVIIVTTIVSYLPTRKIARLKPTDALRGKMT